MNVPADLAYLEDIRRKSVRWAIEARAAGDRDAKRLHLLWAKFYRTRLRLHIVIRTATAVVERRTAGALH